MGTAAEMRLERARLAPGGPCPVRLRPQPAAPASRPRCRPPHSQGREETEGGPRRRPGGGGGPAMTEAARRKAVAKPPSRMPVRGAVLWTGMALGTFLAFLALTHDVMLPGLNGFLAAVLTFALL